MRETPVEYPKIVIGCPKFIIPVQHNQQQETRCELGEYITCSIYSDYPIHPVYQNVIVLRGVYSTWRPTEGDPHRFDKLEESYLKTLIHETTHWAQRLFFTEEDCVTVHDSSTALVENMARWVAEE